MVGWGATDGDSPIVTGASLRFEPTAGRVVARREVEAIRLPVNWRCDAKWGLGGDAGIWGGITLPHVGHFAPVGTTTFSAASHEPP